MPVVNTLTYLPTFRFRDANGTPVTGKVSADFTKVVIADGAVSALVATVTETASGYYTPSLTPNAVGDWSLILTCVVSGESYDIPYAFAVVTAAQADPVAGLSGVTVTVASPIDPSNDRLALVRGDAYLNADSSAVSFTVTSPSLVGASATFYLKTFAGVTALSKAMTISGTTVRADLTAVETAALTNGTPVYRYEVIATLSGGSTRTLAQGDVWVTD